MIIYQNMLALEYSIHKLSPHRNPWTSLIQSLSESPNDVKFFFMARYGQRLRSPLIDAMITTDNDKFIFRVTPICRQIRDLYTTMTCDTLAIPFPYVIPKIILPLDRQWLRTLFSGGDKMISSLVCDERLLADSSMITMNNRVKIQETMIHNWCYCVLDSEDLCQAW